jgi:hypothetical protein
VPQELLPAIVLALAAALLTAGAVQASGCFPAAERPPALRGAGGSWAIALLLLALALLLAAGLWFATAQLGWPVAVIAAGLGLLAGPLVWQRLAPAGLDRPAGTAASAGLAAAAAMGLALWADTGPSG